jgi:nicotinate phosphoribosyltransferase
VDRLGRPVDLEPGAGEELLVPLLRGGARVEPAEGLSAARGRAAADLASLPAAVRRLEQPAPAPMGLDRGLYDETQRLLAIGGGAS